jgi:hypothetical protein
VMGLWLKRGNQVCERTDTRMFICTSHAGSFILPHSTSHTQSPPHERRSERQACSHKKTEARKTTTKQHQCGTCANTTFAHTSPERKPHQKNTASLLVACHFSLAISHQHPKQEGSFLPTEPLKHRVFPPRDTENTPFLLDQNQSKQNPNQSTPANTPCQPNTPQTTPHTSQTTPHTSQTTPHISHNTDTQTASRNTAQQQTTTDTHRVVRRVRLTKLPAAMLPMALLRRSLRLATPQPQRNNPK